MAKKFKKITKTALNKTLRKTSRNIGKETLKVFEKSFSKGGFEKPDGKFKRWAKRKHKYPHPVLKDTRKLQKGFRFKANKDGFTISNKTPYSSYVQEGSAHNAARPIMYHSKTIDKIVVKELDKMVLGLLKGK